MLPTHAYEDHVPPLSSGSRAEPLADDARHALIVAAAEADRGQFPSSPYARIDARSTAETIRLMERWRPRVVAVDWEAAEFDGPQICTVARQMAGTGVLVTMVRPDGAPAALKAGCHAVLLKPLTPILIAARLGRLAREVPLTAAASRFTEKLGQVGINRTWPEIACPQCHTGGAVSFEYHSHRRSWYACLSCESVWMGRSIE